MDPKAKQEICDDWINRVFGDGFKNRGRASEIEDPFYHTVSSEWSEIVEILFSNRPVDGALVLPEEFIRLRAVQEISAAEAVSHIFVLKDIMRERFGDDRGFNDLSRRLDFLALHTFNSYMQCRDRLFKLRLTEIKEYGASETFSCPSSQFKK